MTAKIEELIEHVKNIYVESRPMTSGEMEGIVQALEDFKKLERQKEIDEMFFRR